MTVKLGGRVASALDFNTSHLVVDAPGGKAIRTLKYMQALLLGAQVVDQSWVVDSAKAGHWCDDGPYCVQGSGDVAYLPAEARKEPLFGGVKLRVEGKPHAGQSVEDLEILIRTGGGQICPAEDTPDFVILSKPTLALKQKYRDSAGRVDISWLFDSISNYRLLPADDYRI